MDARGVGGFVSKFDKVRRSDCMVKSERGEVGRRRCVSSVIRSLFCDRRLVMPMVMWLGGMENDCWSVLDRTSVDDVGFILQLVKVI